MSTQREVTQFYDSLVFPSRVDNSPYSILASKFIKDGLRIGDFGCGQSLFYSVFENLTPEPVFLDVSFNALKTIDYGIKLQADICHLPLQNGTFHAVFCIGVIHHLPDMDAALQELIRVVTRDGVLVIGVYSANSVGAHVKRAYDRISNRFLKRGFVCGATVLLWTKLRARFKLSWKDAQKRIADLLDTPIVRYLSTTSYEKIASQAGLIVIDRRSISNMTVFCFKKDCASQPTSQDQDQRQTTVLRTE